MSSGLKLTYFDVQGLGEAIRLLLHDNKVAFEDYRFKKEDWPTLKPQMVFGQVPCLTDNGKQICQSGAILRHLARKFNLYGSPEEMTYVDEMHDGVVDMRNRFNRMIYTEYGTKDEFLKNVLPEDLAKFEKLLKGKKYFLGDKVSFADYPFYVCLDSFLKLDPHTLDSFPTLKAYHTNFQSRPNMREYLQSDLHKTRAFTGSGKL